MAVVVLLAMAGWSGRAAGAGEPTAVVSSSHVALGDVLYVTLDGWSQGTVTVAICGNDARRGSQDCDLRGATAEGPFGRPGPVTVGLIVGSPPAPCPCVLRVSTPTTDVVRTAPVEIDGMPVANVVGPDRPAERLQVTGQILSGRASLVDRLRSSFGGRVGRTLVVSMKNVGTTPLSQVSLSAAVGRDLQSGEPLTAPTVEPIAPGDTREYRLPVTLPAPSFGRYVVFGTAYVPNGAVRFEVVTSTTPQLLLAAGGGLVVLLLVATYRYARRRLAERRSRRRGARPAPVPIPVPIPEVVPSLPPVRVPRTPVPQLAPVGAPDARARGLVTVAVASPSSRVVGDIGPDRSPPVACDAWSAAAGSTDFAPPGSAATGLIDWSLVAGPPRAMAFGSWLPLGAPGAASSGGIDADGPPPRDWEPPERSSDSPAPKPPRPSDWAPPGTDCDAPPAPFGTDWSPPAGPPADDVPTSANPPKGPPLGAAGDAVDRSTCVSTTPADAPTVRRVPPHPPSPPSRLAVPRPPATPSTAAARPGVSLRPAGGPRGRVFRSSRGAAATAAAAVVITVLVAVAARPSGGLDPKVVGSAALVGTSASPSTTAVAGGSSRAAATTTVVGEVTAGNGDQAGGSAAATDVDSVAKADVPADITVEGNLGLRDGQEVKVTVAGEGAEIFGFEAFLCAGGVQFEQDADVRPTQSGKCVSKPLSEGTDRYQEARATPGSTVVEATFKVGAGTDSYDMSDGTPVTITCGPGQPCQLVLKVQFTNGFGFRAYPLEYA